MKFGAASHKVLGALRGISAIGIGTSALVARYSIAASAEALASLVQSPPNRTESLGPLVSSRSTERGVHAVFSNAELDISIIADDVVVIEWTPGEAPLPYATDGASKWSQPTVTTSGDGDGDGWVATGGDIRVSLLVDGTVRIGNAGSGELWESRPPRRRGQGWLHRARLRSDERVYGLGLQAAPLNLRGHSFTLWNRDPGGSYGPGQNPLYMSIPVYMGLHSTGSYLVFHENSHRGRVHIGSRLDAEFRGGMLRTYVMIGEPATLLERYTELTGRPMMPPRWALGYHQSRWGYASEGEVEEVARRFEELDIPLDAIHLDLDYMDGFRVFTIDPGKFPDMAGLASRLGEKGIHLVAIVDCGVKVDESFSVYSEGMEQHRFCTLKDGQVSRGVVWPGMCAFPDFTDPEVRQWWGNHYSALTDAGITGIWHDMNEPTSLAMWGTRSLSPTTLHHMEGRGGDHMEAHNLYALAQNAAAFEALVKLRPEARPFLLTRSGWAGVQRHAWHWTADVDTSWDGLRQQIPSLLGLGLSGVAYSGSDIGGFSSSPSAELYLRWLQAAVFMPFCRTHSSVSTGHREPWCFDLDTQTHIRSAIRTRYRILPYLYTLAHHAALTGHPLMRPLWWLDRSDPELWDVDDCFLLGDDLLVAPVLEAKGANRLVNIPAGYWYDLFEEFDCGKPDFAEATIAGGRLAGFATPLDRIPVLVRAGSILPLALLPPTGTKGDAFSGGPQPIELHLFPDSDGNAEGCLYTDAGDGYGPSRFEHFALHKAGPRFSFHRVADGALPAEAEITIVAHGFPLISAALDGTSLAGATPDGARHDGAGVAVESEGHRVTIPGSFRELILESG